MPVENSVRRIQIVIDSKGVPGLKDLAKQMGGVNKEIKQTNSTLGSLKNGFNAIFFGSLAGVGLKNLTDAADSMQNLGNRIEILSGNSAEAAVTMRGLLEAANRTKTSVDGLATIYARLAASTEEAGLSSTTLLKTTEILQNTFRLSGATTAEATNAAVQLSQGFASGQLRGQELRSVLEQNVIIGGILSKSLGKTRGELYKFAEAGKLTSGVVLKALFDNMDDIDKKSEKLGQTFDQTLTVAANDFKFAIGEINKEFALSDKFAKFVASSIKDARTLGSAFTELASEAKDASSIFDDLLPEGFTDSLIRAIPYVKEFQARRQVLDALERDGGVRGAASKKIDEVSDGYNKFRKVIVENIIAFKDLIGVQSTFEKQSLDAINKKVDRVPLRNLVDASGESDRQLFEQIRKLDELEKAQKEIDTLNKKGNVEIDKRSVLLEKLNKEYQTGAITISEYYDQLEGLDKLEAKRLFLKGKKDLEQYNEELRKLKITELNRDYNQLILTYSQFNEELEKNGIQKLNEQMESGKISLREYDAELVKISEKFQPGASFRSGAEDYIKSVGTLSQQISQSVSRTFSSLEDSLFEFTKNGKFNFNDFAQSVLDDLNRIILRSLIIRPLAQGLIGGFGDTSAGVGNSFGPGNVPGGVNMYSAKGNVFSSPTLHGYGSGKIGMLGEAGPEAVLPLKRDGSGALGVAASSAPVIVNITNNSDSSISQSESTDSTGTKVIDVLIESKIKDAFAKGAMDKTMSSAYGIRRRGT